jgi:DNA-binding transcriptional ArsR family regulator
MSIALMTMVWKTSLPSGQKMVLLALCDNANDQGECYPSVTMLAEKCSMGERTVQQHIADLEAAGIVTREMRTGRSTMYHINPRKICTPAKSAPPQISHPTPADSAPPPPQISHPTPADSAPITINEPSIESSRNRQRRAKPVAIALPDWLPPDVWQSWVEYRKSIKAPLTDKAATLCLAKLMKLREAGQDPVAVIDQSIMSGKWTGLFPVKDDLSQQSHAPKRSSEARGSEPVRLVAGRDYV